MQAVVKQSERKSASDHVNDENRLQESRFILGAVFLTF